MFDSSRLALEAHRLHGSKRSDFLREHCGADEGKRAAVNRKLVELDQISATLPPGIADSDPGQTVDPGQTDDRGQTDDLGQTTEPTGGPAETSAPDRQGTGDDYVTLDFECSYALDSEERRVAETILDQFRSDCSGSQVPDWLSRIPDQSSDQLKRYLAHHLVRFELSHREEHGLPTHPASYLSRAPRYRQEVQAALTIREQYSKTPSIRRGQSGTKSKSNDMEWEMEQGSLASMRYLPERMHAKGGLGAVYRGRDKELGRTVAIKRILPKYESVPQCRDRFIFEAEVTGSLEHPGVVPIYGLNSYDDNKPYYAMRFIRGESFGNAIRKFHEQHPSLTTGAFDSRDFRGLLRRLIDCCNAMHYAHERGVLHRDLKPDNVMLGPYGETLVVDWGLALVMDSDAVPPEDADSVEDTLPIQSKGNNVSEGSTVGTPHYMSPEQAKGVHGSLNPGTDIYALGAILFRMVCNRPCVEGKTFLEVISNVRDGNVLELNETLPVAPRALASICRRCLAYAPSQRYQTAAELAEDIDRWMNDEPVLAHANFETAGEKAGRMIRRYRSWTLSVATALIVVTLVAIVATILIERAKAREKVAKVQAQRFKAEAVDRYRQSREAIDTWLVQSSDALQFFPGTRSVRARLLTLATEDYATLASDRSDDPELELERVRALIRLGDLHQAGSDYQVARDTYQRAIRSLEATPEFLSRPDFQSERGHARSRMGVAWSAEEEIEEAKRAFASAVEQLVNIAAPRPAATQRYLASAYINFAEAALQKKDLGQADKLLAASIEAIEQIGAKEQPRDTMMKTRATELLARMKLTQGDHQDAAGYLEQASSWMRELVRNQPDQPEFADALASLLILKANIARQQGERRGEQHSLREAVKMYRQLHAAIPDYPLYQENLALTLTDLGLALHEAHRCLDAKPLLEESIVLLRSLTENYANSVRYQDTIAATQDGLGQVLLEMGELDEAQQQLTASLITYRELSKKVSDKPDYYERLAIVQSHLAQAVARSVASSNEEDVAEAETLTMVRDGFEAAEKTLTELTEIFPNVPQYRRSLAHVCFEEARILSRYGQEDENAVWKRAAEHFETLSKEGDLASSERLAWLLLLQKPTENEDLDRAVDEAQKAFQAMPSSVRYRGTFALACVATGQAQQAVSLTKPWLVEGAELTGRQCKILSVIAGALGQTEQSRSYRKQSRQWYAEQAPEHRFRNLEFSWEPTGGGEAIWED